MASILLAALFLAAPPDGAGPVVSPSEESAAASAKSIRAPHELRAAVTEGLRREATTKGAEHDQAVRSLVELFQEIAKSEAIAPSNREQLLATLRARLVRVKSTIKVSVAGDRPSETRRPCAGAHRSSGRF